MFILFCSLVSLVLVSIPVCSVLMFHALERTDYSEKDDQPIGW